MKMRKKTNSLSSREKIWRTFVRSLWNFRQQWSNVTSGINQRFNFETILFLGMIEDSCTRRYFLLLDAILHQLSEVSDQNQPTKNLAEPNSQNFRRIYLSVGKSFTQILTNSNLVINSGQIYKPKDWWTESKIFIGKLSFLWEATFAVHIF